MPSWTRALVTGASAGLGREFADQLAAGGVDLVLVARSVDRMTSHAEELRRDHGIAVEVLAVDLTDEAGLEQVVARVHAADEPVDLVVNNAGYGTVGRFDRQTAASQTGMIDLNIRAVVALTTAAVAAFTERGVAGGVLNVASLGAFQPVPLMATYAATKAFVKSFTEAVHEELRGSPIHVTALCPGFTRTEFAERAEVGDDVLPDWMWMGAEPVVRAGLAGVASGRAVVLPGLGNKVVGNLSNQTPSWLSRQVGSLLGRGL